MMVAAETVKRFPGLFCCVMECEAEAMFQIEGTHHHPDDNTQACEAHVGELLGTPDWADYENTWWDVGLIPESELERWRTEEGG